MAFDGMVVAAMADELGHALVGGRVAKIAQPEPDELMLTIKNGGKTLRLLISAGASLPLLYLTDTNKPGPPTAPNFCMLLRKYLNGGKIVAVEQPGLERILHFTVEHRNEMGDLCQKVLTVELMGKHSNVIFRTAETPDAPASIIDSIKHVSAQVSSVREVLPGRPYFIPNTLQKLDPLLVTRETFLQTIGSRPMPLAKALYQSLTGFSPVMAEELCHRASLESGQSANSFGELELLHLFGQFSQLMDTIRQRDFTPTIYSEISPDALRRPSDAQDRPSGNIVPAQSPGALRRPSDAQDFPKGNIVPAQSPDTLRKSSYAQDRPKGNPVEFSVVPLHMYRDMDATVFASVSEMLEAYYAQKNTVTRIRQRSQDLRRVVQTALDRSRKKYDLQQKQLKDTAQRDKYRIYGELINTYGYGLEEGAQSLTAFSYETNEEITIPLDARLSPKENAQKYFARYGKQKRTFEALTDLIQETLGEIRHLESIAASLEIALSEADLVQIKEELVQYGYIRRHAGQKRQKVTSKPFHYLSRDGISIYVGKNNFQNDELTFQFASGNDWWFHAKGAPGSHVIVKAQGEMPPDSTFEDAARLAALYSSLRGAQKAEVDDTERNHLKKPNGGKPGFVIYHTNYSMTIDSDIRGIAQLS